MHHHDDTDHTGPIIVLACLIVIACLLAGAGLAGCIATAPAPTPAGVEACALIYGGDTYCVACNCGTGECDFAQCSGGEPLCTDSLCRE